jgi:hypothetical protein
MKISFNKKLLLLLSIGIIGISNIQADDFNWSSYKKTLPASIIQGNDLTKRERTQENIKKRLDVDVERRTLSEIKQGQNSKSLTISALFRNSETYVSGVSAPIPGVSAGSVGVENETSQIGVSISGRFDLISIGKKFNNTYATVDVFQDSIWIGVSRRIQADDRLGLFSDIGGGLFFQMKDTVRKEDMYMYGFYKIGYNFEDWNIKAGINIPSDAFDNGFFDTTQFNLSIGWRF